MIRSGRALLAAVTLAACTPDAAEERALGERVAREYAAELPLRDSTDLVSRYVQALGDSLARRADPRGWQYHVRVVDDSTINAFALPGGWIFVHGGLLRALPDRDALASVLAHEISHVVRRHAVDQQVKQQRTGIGMTIVCLFVDVCSSEAAQVAIRAGASALFAKYSRDDETEADRDAVLTLAAAGMDPQAVPRMLGVLQRTREGSPTVLDAFFGSHPLEESRIRATTSVADSVSRRAPPRAARAGRDTAFEAMMAALRLPARRGIPRITGAPDPADTAATLAWIDAARQQLDADTTRMQRVVRTRDPGAGARSVVTGWLVGPVLRRIREEVAGPGFRTGDDYWYVNGSLAAVRLEADRAGRPRQVDEIWFRAGRVYRWRDPEGRLLNRGSQSTQSEADMLRTRADSLVALLSRPQAADPAPSRPSSTDSAPVP